jgi:hypothetical protein
MALTKVTHNVLSNRYTASVAISTLTGTVSFNCANGSVFKLSGDLNTDPLAQLKDTVPVNVDIATLAVYLFDKTLCVTFVNAIFYFLRK